MKQKKYHFNTKKRITEGLTKEKTMPNNEQQLPSFPWPIQRKGGSRDWSPTLGPRCTVQIPLKKMFAKVQSISDFLYHHLSSILDAHEKVLLISNENMNFLSRRKTVSLR